MKIIKQAVAGTLESSDLLVKVAPNDSSLDIVIQSEVIKQFGKQIRRTVAETLGKLESIKGLWSSKIRGHWIMRFARESRLRSCVPPARRS